MLKAIAPWFGGKRKLGPIIALEAGEHHTYFSMCCGSLADILAKEPAKQETAVDLYGHVINLARVLQDDALVLQLYERLQRTLCTEEIFCRARAFYKEHPVISNTSTPDIEAAYCYFVMSWIGVGGISGSVGTQTMSIQWTSTGGGSATRFVSAINSLPSWHCRLRHVNVICRNIFDVLPKITDELGVVIYVDPPYLSVTRGSGRVYLHEFVYDDHTRLAVELQRFREVRVIVSYYDHPRLEELYPGWTKRILPPRLVSLRAQFDPDSTARVAPEVFLINGPSLAKTKAPSFFEGYSL